MITFLVMDYYANFWLNVVRLVGGQKEGVDGYGGEPVKTQTYTGSADYAN